MRVTPGYREWAPPPPLRHAVTCVWSQVVGEEPARSVLVLPDACSDLMWQAGRGAFVAGPDTSAWEVALAPGTVLLGVRFAPGAGGPALRTSLEGLQNRRVDVADVLPGVSTLLHGDLPAKMALERLLGTAARLVDERPPDPTVRAAAGLLADPSVRLSAVTGELGISERQLRRRCHETVGYGPKTLQRVLRFRRFVDRVTAGPNPDLALLAALSGYADQAHLTRECQDLANATPAVLAGLRRPVAGRRPA